MSKCKRFFAAMLAALLLLCSLCGCAPKITVDQAREGVVRLLVETVDGSYAVASAIGVGKSGEPTYFVTNHHAVSDEFGNQAANVYILKDNFAAPLTPNGALDPSQLDKSRMIPCSIIYRAQNGTPDLAIIKSAEPVEGRRCLPLAEAEKTVKAGDTVYALGYPHSADMAGQTEVGGNLAAGIEDITVTSGVVSRITEYGPMNNTVIIQHTASINGGNSGGALVTEDGYVVGVNTISFNGSGLTSSEQNHYGAVEIEYVMDILDDHDIEYVDATPGQFPIMIVIIAIAAIAIVLVIVVVVVVVSKNKKSAPPVVQPPVTPYPPVNPPISQPPISAPPVQQPVSNPGFRIQGISGKFENRRFAVGATLRIGRDANRNDLVYPSDTKGISGVHCLLTTQGNRLFLQDLGSTYGTYVAGNRLAASQTIELRKGDRFWLGSEQQAFVVDYKG